MINWASMTKHDKIISVIGRDTVATLWVGLPGTGPPSSLFGPLSSLARQFFWFTHFLCLAYTVLSGYKFYYNRLITNCH